MTKGFQLSTDETKIQVIIKRISPAVLRKDERAVGEGVRRMTERYGQDLVDVAWQQLMQQHSWLFDCFYKSLSGNRKSMVHDDAYEVMAQQLENNGLRLEDHLRVCDQGFALTKQAVEAIKATGYPHTADFGEGLDSLEGVGINRYPYMHRLSEISPNHEHVNLWALASLLISSAQNWLDEPPDDPQIPLNNLKQAVMRAAPTIDFEKLLFRSRYDDRALLWLASLAEQGVRILAKAA